MTTLKNMDYEAIIIGCGPAGLSAGIYLGRAKVKTVLIGKHKESQLVKAHKIENFFGFPEGITGVDLIKKGMTQVKKFGVKILNNEVVGADIVKGGFKVKLEDGKSISSKVLIIATGTPIRLTGIDKEEALTGKGVHYCVDCDGAVYKNKKVAVVGNGNLAAESALDLKIFTKDVTLISNDDKFVFSKRMGDEVKKQKIKLINKRVKGFSGKKFLEDVVFYDGERVKFYGVFMGCGTASALDFAAKLGLKITGNILNVDGMNMTSIKGIFAAGNCCGKCRQVAKNVGDGCNAALSSIKYLRNKEVYFDYSVGVKK